MRSLFLRSQRIALLVLLLPLAAVSPSRIAYAAGSTPTSIEATSTPGTGTATITWVAAPEATSHQARILIGTTAFDNSAILGASATSYTFVGLDYNIPYKLQVKSNDSSWADGNASPSPLTLTAASPSAPAQPKLEAIDARKLKVTWSRPLSDGGSPISSYSVQLLTGGNALVAPVIVIGLDTEINTNDQTTLYSVTVSAINKAGKKSSPSEESIAKLAVKPPVADVDSPTDPNDDSPSDDSGGAEDSGGATDGGTSIVNLVAATPVAKPVISYSKSVYVTTRISTKTLFKLSRLARPKKSTVTYKLSASSKKYCRLKKTVVTAIRSGTCSITVTVKQKSGKKTSKVVKLIVRAKR